MDATSTAAIEPYLAPDSAREAEPSSAFEDLIVSGRGSWLTAKAGRRFLDFIQGAGANCLGHCSPVMKGALLYQSSHLITCDDAYDSAPAERLRSVLSLRSGLRQVRFVSGASPARALAIKVAYQGGPDNAPIVALGATPSILPSNQDIRRVPLNDLTALERALDGNVALVALEPISLDGQGISARYLKDVRALTRARNVRLVLDETRSGIGRTGTLFAFQASDIQPDVLVLGRSLAGGLPLAAVLAAEEEFPILLNAGDMVPVSPLMAAVGTAVMAKVTQSSFMRNLDDRSCQLAGDLRRLADRRGLGVVSGRGLLLALDLPRQDAFEAALRARELGLLIAAPRADQLIFTPSLTVTAAEIARAMAILDQALAGSK